MKKNNKLRPFTRQFYRGNGWHLALAMVHTLLSTAAAMMVSWLLQLIIDMATGADIGFSFTQIVILTAVCLLTDAAAWGCAYLSKPQFIARGIGQYKEYVFERICEKGLSAFSGENSSLYISALSNDAASIESNYLGNIFVIVECILMFAGALGLMFYYSPLLTAISIALSLLPLLVSILTGGLVAKAEKQVSDRNAAYMTTLKDSLQGFSVIKSFRAELQMCRIFAEQVRAVSGAKCFRRKMSILVRLLASFAGSFVQLGVFLIGAYLALTSTGISAGSVLVFGQLLNFVINPIGTIPTALAEITASKALIVKIADALEDNVREEGATHKTTRDSAITVRDLTFGYEAGKTVLRDVDFTFRRGKRYAIVGASGSGKSTLLSLLMASRSDYSGTILYDDTPLGQISSESLYEMVSMVQQNVFIFNASIRDNITMFSDFPREEIDRAIELSGLSALIAERGEDDCCGENGSGLSGGEKQRISIARSLLKKTQVLFVDEATAALDAETAYQVTSAILGLSDMTSIVVTHSLDEGLLRQYDCILTLKNGMVVETGNFDELIAQKGYFYSLYTVSQ